jgi:hypothetical protein
MRTVSEAGKAANTSFAVTLIPSSESNPLLYRSARGHNALLARALLLPHTNRNFAHVCECFHKSIRQGICVDFPSSDPGIGRTGSKQIESSQYFIGSNLHSLGIEDLRNALSESKVPSPAATNIVRVTKLEDAPRNQNTFAFNLDPAAHRRDCGFVCYC